jgi:hypothetical protein
MEKDHKNAGSMKWNVQNFSGENFKQEHLGTNGKKHITNPKTA